MNVKNVYIVSRHRIENKKTIENRRLFLSKYINYEVQNNGYSNQVDFYVSFPGSSSTDANFLRGGAVIDFDFIADNGGSRISLILHGPIVPYFLSIFQLLTSHIYTFAKNKFYDHRLYGKLMKFIICGNVLKFC